MEDGCRPGVSGVWMATDDDLVEGVGGGDGL